MWLAHTVPIIMCFSRILWWKWLWVISESYLKKRFCAFFFLKMEIWLSQPRDCQTEVQTCSVTREGCPWTMWGASSLLPFVLSTHFQPLAVLADCPEWSPSPETFLFKEKPFRVLSCTSSMGWVPIWWPSSGAKGLALRCIWGNSNWLCWLQGIMKGICCHGILFRYFFVLSGSLNSLGD